MLHATDIACPSSCFKHSQDPLQLRKIFILLHIHPSQVHTLDIFECAYLREPRGIYEMAAFQNPSGRNFQNSDPDKAMGTKLRNSQDQGMALSSNSQASRTR